MLDWFPAHSKSKRGIPAPLRWTAHSCKKLWVDLQFVHCGTRLLADSPCFLACGVQSKLASHRVTTHFRWPSSRQEPWDLRRQHLKKNELPLMVEVFWVLRDSVWQYPWWKRVYTYYVNFDNHTYSWRFMRFLRSFLHTLSPPFCWDFDSLWGPLVRPCHGVSHTGQFFGWCFSRLSAFRSFHFFIIYWDLMEGHLEIPMALCTFHQNFSPTLANANGC